jgi:hypothetical protein
MKWRDFPWTEVVVLVLATVAIVALAYAGYLRQRAQAPRYDTLSSYDAHRGGYRAWFELLGRMGVRVDRFAQRPAFLDRSIDALIVAPNINELTLRAQQTADTIGALQPIDYDNLLTWVKQGGRLIWVTDGTYDTNLELPAPEARGPKRDNAVTVSVSPLTAGVASLSGTSDLRIRFSTAAKVQPLVADDSGAVVAQYRLGKGTIVVVTDQTLFENARLNKAGNARLAYNLATGGDPKATVAFDEWVHGYATGATLWAILPVPVRAGLIITAAALLLLLVGTTLRFGPTARLPENAERTSAEYLSSMAQLLARGRAASRALQDLATLTFRDAAASVGLSDRASVAEIAARMQGGDASERADQLRELDALSRRYRPSEAELLRAAQLSATLRKELARYGRIGFGRRATSLGRTA